MTQRSRSKQLAQRLSRDFVLGIIGAAIVLNEAFLRDTERSTLLLVGAALLGVPVWLRVDERRQRSNDSDES